MIESMSKTQNKQTAASPRKIRNICCYCGSAAGTSPHYDAAARQFGEILARQNIGLVYGGGDRGLMGIVSNAARMHGGTVTGIIPDFLIDREGLAADAQNQIIVPDMHTRKRLMFEQADAFVALPGGIGTLEELIEQLSWVQLGRHTKPVVITDIGGFWRPLLAVFQHMREHGFLRSEFEVQYLVAEKVEDIVPMIEASLARTEARGAVQETLDTRL
jgi:uncharacterized protein (TIGR00730 family)